MEWMPVRCDLWDDERVLNLTDLLNAGNLAGHGLTLDDVVSKTQRAWAWARKRTANGKVVGATPRTLDLVIRCDGFAHALAHASVGWLEIHESSGPNDPPYLRFPRWDRWNSKGAKARLQAAKRQARNRVTRVTPASRSRHAERGTNSRADNSREQRRAEAAAAGPTNPSRLCSLLLRLVDTDAGGAPLHIFDGPTCAAIAEDARCTEMRIVWAVERLRAKRTRPRDKAAWLRAMILDDTKQPPRGWVEQYQRRKLAELEGASLLRGPAADTTNATGARKELAAGESESTMKEPEAFGAAAWVGGAVPAPEAGGAAGGARGAGDGGR